jgi:hypothetical protein
LTRQLSQDKTVPNTLDTKESRSEDKKAEEGKPAKSGRGVWDTTRSVAKLLLKAVGEFSEALPPLKAVVAGLQLIVDHVEVRFCPCAGECIMTTVGIVGDRQSG